MITPTRRKPVITISQTERERLVALAGLLAERNAELSDTLLDEIERARIVPDGSVADNVVRIGSHVTYQTTDDEETKAVTLVYPGDADIDRGRVAVTTPVGIALIGLSTGQSITWTARDGRVHELKVVEVSQPDEASPD